MEKLKLLFIRPPRHYWPILNEADNFLLPLAYPTLAAYIRQEIPDLVDITIMDCCAHMMGWQSLEKYLIEQKPDILAIGEKVCYAKEAERAFLLAKKVIPECTTLAGGVFYSHIPEEVIGKEKGVDYIIRFEGEVALVEFLKSYHKKESMGKVPNLVYMDKGKIRYNQIAPLLDMDTLPLPAYDIASIDKYQAFGKLYPKSVTVQRSRGCTFNCSYCSWIAQESQYSIQGDKLKRQAIYRSKTPKQMLDEIDILYNKYNIRYLFWVDATWNYDDKWLNEFCDGIIERDYDLGWWAFIRLDMIPEQHRNGTLTKMVKAGLRHILSGADRPDKRGMKTLTKQQQTKDVVKEAIYIFRDHYPEVFRQCTLIAGLPDDNAEDIKALLSYAHELDLDFAAFHTLTPFPGTPLAEAAKKSGLLLENDYSNYDMYFPVMKTKHLNQDEVSHWIMWCQLNFVLRKPFKYFFRMFSRYKMRRVLHRWFAFSVNRVLFIQIWNHIRGIEKFEGFSGVNKLWKPSWYEK